MIYHTEPCLRIYFGDAKNQLFPYDYLQWHDNLLLREQFAALDPLNLDSLYFLHQIHSNYGQIITQETEFAPFSREGDFLLTDQSHVGLGVMTADCVPVIIYDKKKRAIAVVHAGWRGAVKGVVLEALAQMRHYYDSQYADLKIFLGPSIKKCCYEVGDTFADNLEDYFFGSSYIYKKTTGHFFDLPGFLVEQLVEYTQIPKNSIFLGYNACTMCDTIFWSHRRGTKSGFPETIGRQMTVATLV